MRLGQLAAGVIGDAQDMMPAPDWKLNYRGVPVTPTSPQEAEATPVGMKLFRFKGPDGMIHKISGPADATPEEAFAQLQQQLSAQPAPAEGALSQLERYGENALKGGAALGTGAAKGVASVAGMAGDLAQNLAPSNDADRLMAMTDPIWWISRQFPKTQDIRTAFSNLSGGASEWKPDPTDPNYRVLSDIQAAGEALPTWGRKLGLAALSGVLGNEVENSNLFGANNPWARVAGNVSPVALPIVGKSIATLAHGLHAIPEFMQAIMQVVKHPLEAAANAAVPATSAEMQYQSDNPLTPSQPSELSQALMKYLGQIGQSGAITGQ